MATYTNNMYFKVNLLPANTISSVTGAGSGLLGNDSAPWEKVVTDVLQIGWSNNTSMDEAATNGTSIGMDKTFGVLVKVSGDNMFEVDAQGQSAFHIIGGSSPKTTFGGYTPVSFLGTIGLNEYATYGNTLPASEYSYKGRIFFKKVS